MKAKARIRIVRPRRKPRGLGHQRRAEILAAAKQLFLKQGYENFTTRKLAARVGLSQTGVYVYFKSKEEILDAVCRSTFEGLAQRIRAMSAESKDSPDAIRRLLKAYVEFGLQHPDEYQLTFMVGNSAPKFTRRKDLSQPFELQGIGVQCFLLFRDQVARLIEGGQLKDGDVSLVTQTLWATAHGLVSLMIARPGYLLSERGPLVKAAVVALMTGLQANSP
ncbi:MAG: TetR/AcrR family transcriptional regulator [Candidatus Binatus sp.]